MSGDLFFSKMLDAAEKKRVRDIEAYHPVRLGPLLAMVKAVPPQTPIPGVSDKVNSYRGYYEDLAIEPSPEGTTAGALARVLEAALWSVFIGYKGGFYTMGEQTFVWLSRYGSVSDMLVTGVAHHHDTLSLIMTEVEW